MVICRGANINMHDKDNFSPLLLAACNGHAETIETLLSNGANVNDVDKNDKTALYWAAEEDHLEALKVSSVTWKQQVYNDNKTKTSHAQLWQFSV